MLRPAPARALSKGVDRSSAQVESAARLRLRAASCDGRPQLNNAVNILGYETADSRCEQQMYVNASHLAHWRRDKPLHSAQNSENESSTQLLPRHSFRLICIHWICAQRHLTECADKQVHANTFVFLDLFTCERGGFHCGKEASNSASSNQWTLSFDRCCSIAAAQGYNGSMGSIQRRVLARVLPPPIGFFDAIPNSPDVCMPLHMRLPQEMFCVLHCAGMRCVRTLEARGIL